MAIALVPPSRTTDNGPRTTDLLMRIAVLAAADSWYFADLQRAAADQHELSAVSFRALGSTVLGSETSVNDLTVAASGVDLRSFDAVLVRTMPAGSLEQVVFRMDGLAQLEAA